MKDYKKISLEESFALIDKMINPEHREEKKRSELTEIRTRPVCHIASENKQTKENDNK